mmetsp:Transcript_12012/g.21817  ORF Transcript_12012/g.21817 Transcript_12012/m.21817 type:complete len:200 (-) Transcript_12012:2521-3120(-)
MIRGSAVMLFRRFTLSVKVAASMLSCLARLTIAPLSERAGESSSMLAMTFSRSALILIVVLPALPGDFDFLDLRALGAAASDSPLPSGGKESALTTALSAIFGLLSCFGEVMGGSLMSSAVLGGLTVKTSTLVWPRPWRMLLPLPRPSSAPSRVCFLKAFILSERAWISSRVSRTSSSSLSSSSSSSLPSSSSSSTSSK